ncbi:MAG TPA: M56 family metallopeptidase [Acidimicrobiales bacterium]|nr:M56 family metallopeptidase [Acidimicrobiales bacterium]
MVELGAVLWAVPTLLRNAGVPALAMPCNWLLCPLLPLGAAGGAFGGVIAVGLPIRAWRGWRHTHAQIDALVIEPAFGCHHHRNGYELVILPTSQPLAYSVSGSSPQVVLSEGFCDTLADVQVDAVIAHEVAHLSHRHPDLLRGASLAAASLAWWPLTGRSYGVLRNAFERWADDEASRGDDDRRVALRDAIVATAMADQPTGVAAFSLAEATAERVEALQEQPSAPVPARRWFCMPGAAAGVLAAVTFETWIHQGQLLFAMPGGCIG